MSDNLLETLNNIKKGYIMDISSLTIDDYLSKDENGITFIEHLLKNNYKNKADYN